MVTLPTDLISLEKELHAFALHHQEKGVAGADTYMVEQRNKFYEHPQDGSQEQYNEGRRVGIRYACDWLKEYQASLRDQLGYDKP